MTEQQHKPEPKKRVNSKAKGSNFERHICGVLSKALTPLNFKRTQQSGAITGGKNSQFNSLFSKEALSIFVGDIFVANEADVFRDEGWKFKFTLECKFYKTCDNLDHIMDPNTRIKVWFEQAYTDSLKLGKEPLLIFKFNHTETFCAVNAKTIDRHPGKLTTWMRLNFSDGRAMDIFLLKDALLDLDWWKLK